MKCQTLVHKRVLKLVNFEVQKVQKLELFDLAATFPCLRGDQGPLHWDMSHKPGPILQQKKRQGPPVLKFYSLELDSEVGQLVVLILDSHNFKPQYLEAQTHPS